MSGNFDIDRDFLPDKVSKEIGKLSIPIILRNNYPYIEIPIYSEKGIKNIPLFIDKNILTNIKEYSRKLSELMSCMKEDLFIYKQSAIDNFVYPSNKSKISKESLKKYFDNGNISNDSNKVLSLEQNKIYVYTKFTTYLYEICNHFIDLFKIYFNRDEDIRIFFRYYNIKKPTEKKYIQICQQSKSNLEGRTNNNARDVDFEGLIEKSYKIKAPLVFSSNSWYNNLEPKKWNNFITIVPTFNNYEYNIEGDLLPIITCAISTKSATSEPFLDVLNYINIHEILSNIITSYLNVFQINIQNCADFYFEDREKKNENYSNK